MSDILFIRPITWPSCEHVEWVTRKGKEIGRVRQGSLVEAAEHVGRQIVLVVPGAHVSLMEADVPAVKQQASLAKFALEDQLADDIDSLHFAFGKRAGGGLPVAALNTHDFAIAIAALEAQQLAPKAAVVDMQYLPYEVGVTAVYVEGEDSLIRSGNAQASCLPTDILADMLAGEAINLLGPAQTDVIDSLRQQCDVKNQNADVEILALVASSYERQGINLCQGAFGASNETSSASLKVWRTPLVLVGVVMLLLLGTQFAANHQAEQRLGPLLEERKRLFAELMPGRKLVRPKSVIRAELKKLSGGDSSSAAVNPLEMLEASQRALLGIQNLSWQKIDFNGNRLRATVVIKKARDFDLIKQKFATASVRLNKSTSRTVKEGIEVRLEIMPKGAR